MLRVQLKPADGETLTLTELAARAGLLGARIAQWERRFGWPVSTRDSHGRRRYPAHLVPDLREAARRSDLGRSLRDEIVDGRPVWQTAPRPPAAVYDRERCAAVPQPRTEAARRLREDLLRALDEPGDAAVLAVLARVPTIHPDDRAASVYDVLRSLGHPVAATAPSLETTTAEPAPSIPTTPDPAPPDPVRESPTDPPPVAPDPVAVAVSGSVDSGHEADPADSHAVQVAAAPRARRPTLAAETVADWQAACARSAAAQRQRQAARTARQARRIAFAGLRRALARVELPAPRITSDRLAVAVHQAPEPVRAIIARLLRDLRQKRGRPQSR